MSHFLHRTKVTKSPVAELSHGQRYNAEMTENLRRERGMIERRQAQMHMPRPNALKPPTG